MAQENTQAIIDHLTPFVRNQLDAIANKMIEEAVQEFRMKLIGEKANILIDVLAHMMHTSYVDKEELQITIPIKKKY